MFIDDVTSITKNDESATFFDVIVRFKTHSRYAKEIGFQSNCWSANIRDKTTEVIHLEVLSDVGIEDFYLRGDLKSYGSMELFEKQLQQRKKRFIMKSSDKPCA